MSLLQNQINIYVNANGELVPGSAPTNFLYRNNLNRNVFFIVTPLSEAAVVKLIFKNTSLAKQGYTDVALPTQQKGSNITNETASYYNIVKDWNVFKCIPNETILAKFPSTVTGTIALTVSIKEPDLSDTTLYTFVKDIYTNDTASIEALTNRQYVRCASAQVITAYGTMYVGDKLVNKNGTKIIIHAIWSSSTTEPLEFVGNPALEDNDYEDVVVGDTSLLDSIISTLANQSQSVTQLQSYLSEILTGNTTGASLIHVVDAWPTDTSNIANGTLYALRYLNTYDQKTYEYKFCTWTGSKWLPKDALSYLGGTINSQAIVDAIPNGTYFVLKMDSSFIDHEIIPYFNNSPAILIKTYDTLTCIITSYYCYVYNSIRQTWTTMPLNAEKHVTQDGWKLITSGGVYNAVKSVKDNVDKVVDGTTQVGIAGKAVQDQNGAVINTTYQKVAEKGIAGGYAPLNASGKVPDSYLPSDTSKFYAGTITSGVCAVNQAFITKFGVSTLTISANDINTYDGAYFVATDNFIIASGNAGNAITLTSGDELISHGSVGYAKIDSNNDVVSVNGLTGAVVIRFDNYAGSISSITPTIASGLNVNTRYMTSDGYEFRVSLPQNDRVLLLYEIDDTKVVVVKRGTISTDTWDDNPQYKELVFKEDLSEYAKSVDVLTKNEQGYEKPVSVNIYNKETSVESSWFSSSNGQIETYPTNPYVQQYGRTDYIEVEGSTDYYLSIETLNYINVYIAYFDVNKTFIRNETLHASSAINYTGSSFNTPSNCKYIGISFSRGKGKWIKESHLQIEEGLTPTPYQEYVGDKIYLNKLLIKEEQIKKATISSIIDLPEKYDVVVGDAFELFYNSLLKVRNYKNYYTICICDIGTCLSRKFILRTATSDMIGEHTLTFILYDNLGELVEQKSVVLNVVAKTTSPVNEKVVLCIGDSLTQNGYWVEELNRRLTKNTSVARNGDAAPTGLGLTNIKFIGKCILGETRFEGYGGWDYDNYLSTNVSTMYYVNVASHDKTSADQESIWKDSNNVEWQLETIEANRLKFKKYSGTGVMPLSGTLTWVSGGTHTTSIVFTSSSIAEGNPFNYNGVIDFASYCADMGVSTIDDVYILLGWNSASFSDDAYKTKIETFVDKLIEFNNNIKITLIGLETPSYDGIGNNYGARSLSFISNKNYVYQRNALYESIAKQSKYSGIMTFVQLSGQFDSEYNMPFENRDVNVRNNEKIVEQTNGIHPGVKGFFQIADAVYRKFNAKN